MTPAQLDATYIHIDELRAQVATLTAERDEAQQKAREASRLMTAAAVEGMEWQARAESAEAALSAAVAQNGALREALTGVMESPCGHTTGRQTCLGDEVWSRAEAALAAAPVVKP